MLLKDRIAIVHGAGGFVGGAVARAFAEEGARLFLTGRREGRLAAVAEEIGRLGGPEPGIVRLDVTDPEEVGRHADSVVSEAGRVDIVFNAVSYCDVQGAPLERMPFDRFAAPVTTAPAVQFHPVRAAARHMAERGSGVVLTVIGHGPPSPEPGGTRVAWETVEAMYRQWACEMGSRGVRVAWLRTGGFAESVAGADAYGEDLKVIVEGREVPLSSRSDEATTERELDELARSTVLGALPTLADAGHAAVFLASDRARHVSGAALDLTAGAVID